ncbi:hypothetical protein [Xenorhabdus anantnagensis]|uniref:Transposase n=1 Tax=Xenorhabdus anantnagensis TaxID=3025875 RepID=A0ABT5LWB3_9GAMM|nr:hypothetical protein [Xenorhabdus anantnagensis]MDC9598499.1 hypothetical protein [Xenorhabdus anantnagensis]
MPPRTHRVPNAHGLVAFLFASGYRHLPVLAETSSLSIERTDRIKNSLCHRVVKWSIKIGH